MVNLNYLCNPDAVKDIFTKNYFVDQKLGFSIIENGTVLPHKKISAKEVIRRIWGAGGIVNSKGKFIKRSAVRQGLGEAYTPAESVQRRSETVIYLGLFFPVWGHSITDDIRRVWFLKSDAFKSEFKNCPVVYIPWTGVPLERQQNFRRLLEILEVDVDRLQPITQPTQFDKIILPEDSFCFNKLFTGEYRETIDRIRNFALKNRTPTSAKKIYYLYGKNQIGEERLAEYFRSKGYEIVSPEKLPLDEQLNLMINAESFASTLGSCAHNSIFLRDDKECVFIPRSANAFTAYQPALDQVHPLNVNYVDSSMSVFNMRHDSFCFIISENLKRFFGDKFDGYVEDDFKIFLEYVKDSMINKARLINPRETEGYGKFFQDFWHRLNRREDLITACDMPPHFGEFRPLLTYQTHVGKDGWSAWLGENQISNPLDRQNDIQAIKINFADCNVHYAVRYDDARGWSAEVTSPKAAGTTGKSRSIFGVKIRLDEAGSKKFDIVYRVHKFDSKWTPWAKNGEELLSHGVKLNAIQIKLETKRTLSAQSREELCL